MKPKDSVTLERGHLSLFRYPTRGIGTYLGRGALLVMYVIDIMIFYDSIAWYCMLLRFWLRRAGCVSQDAYILHI